VPPQEKPVSHLGSFGAAVKELDPGADRDTFDLFGEKFEVVGVIPPMLMLQLGAATTGKIDDQEGLGAMWEAMRCSLTKPEADGEPEDGSEFDRLYKVAVGKRCDLDSLMKLAMALFESQAGRPTEEPQGSLPGPPTTSPSSNTSSSASPDSHRLIPVGQLLGG
jgi:hypothetical protein